MTLYLNDLGLLCALSNSKAEVLTRLLASGSGLITSDSRSHAPRGNAVMARCAMSMGRSRYRICAEKAPHFLTCTVLNWIPLFTRPQTAGIVLEALRYRQEQTGWKIYGYVILENHIHMIVQAENLAMELPRFKSYTARKFIDHLKECRAERLLQQLAFFRKDHKRDRDYQCWEEGSHPQLIENEQVLRQKLGYIHQNPVKRGYVDEPTDWRYSSARDYAGLTGLLPVYKSWL